MIYEIHKELATALRARGCPFPVTYGPEPKGIGTPNRTRIVVQRDRDGSEQWILGGAPHHKNPKVPVVRLQAAVIRVVAASTLAGCGVQDHERLCDRILDLVAGSLREIVAARGNVLVIENGKFLSANELDLAGLERWPGVVYDLKISIDRGVTNAAWDGSADPEATLADLANTTNVKLTFATGAAAIGCGGS